MYAAGVDIGSTAAKAAVLDRDGNILFTHVEPTGFSSVDAANRIEQWLESVGANVKDRAVVATGYGRVAVPFADKVVTEITCHGKGAVHLFGPSGTVVDVGGQDTKIIKIDQGMVKKFVMNDKCSAGTGRFLEVMADRLAVSQEELAAIARTGTPAPISNMCTVFAESEVISLVGRGEPRENIASGVIESVVARVATLASQMRGTDYFLTGGLCSNEYFVERLGAHLGAPVKTVEQARYAGAIGAALCALDVLNKR